MDIKKFLERLSCCMEQCGLNGANLSALSGVTTATISWYFNGLRMPTVDKILTATYAIASCDDKRVIWTLLERYGEKHGTTDRK